MRPIGYVVQQHSMRLDRPARAYEKWIGRVPFAYAEYVTERPLSPAVDLIGDPDCLALLKHYRSLMPLAQEARKPMFLLKPADGAIGAHQSATLACREDFRMLAEKIRAKSGLF
jgi:hypothetical protein